MYELYAIDKRLDFLTNIKSMFSSDVVSSDKLFSNQRLKRKNFLKNYKRLLSLVMLSFKTYET